MKQNKKELDVDFIGGQVPITEQEEKAISEYIQAAKKKQTKATPKRRTRSRVTKAKA